VKNYSEWEAAIPAAMTSDPLWKQKVYRLSLFASDIGWSDVTKLMRDKRTLELSDQLYRSLGSIGANIAEGYSRSSGRDRVRFYEYALGSAREARDWYHKGRHICGESVAVHRVDLLTQICRLLLGMIPVERKRLVRPSMAEVAGEPATLVREASLDEWFDGWPDMEVPF
jgi:four helix bundle protein